MQKGKSQKKENGNNNNNRKQILHLQYGKEWA
jgi:hypothetical protein